MIHIRETSLKTDRETERGEPTLGSLGREKGKEEKSKSRDLCNRSLKTGMSWKRERGREEKSKSRDLCNRSLKTDGETKSREPT